MYQCVKSVTEKYWYVAMAVHISFASILYIEVHGSFADILQMWLCTFLLLAFSRCESAHFFYWYSPNMAMHISFADFIHFFHWYSPTVKNPDLHRQYLCTCVTWKWLMQTSQM